jgi:outer membrane protein
VKKIVLLALIIFAGAIFAQTQTSQPAQAQLKLGYVDSEVILAQYPEAVKAKSDLDGMVAKWRKDIDSMAQDYQKSVADYQSKAQTLKKEDLDKLAKSIGEKEQKAQTYNQSKFSQPNGEYYQKQDQLMKPVKEKIFKAIDAVSKDENMQFVFDKAGDVVLLKADPQFDITYKVLDLLKRGKK